MQEFHDITHNDVACYPMVPMRDLVVFPHTKVGIVIGRPWSMRALEEALATDCLIFLATQHDAKVDDPTPEQIYQVGTLAYIINSSRQPGAISVRLESRERARIVRVDERNGYYLATLRRAPVLPEDNNLIAPLVSRIVSLAEQYMKLTKYEDPGQIRAALRAEDPGQLVDRLANQMMLEIEVKQGLLEIYSTRECLLRMIELLESKVS